MTEPQDQLDKINASKSAPGDLQTRAAMDRIRERARKLKLGHFDWETFKADRDTDRS